MSFKLFKSTEDKMVEAMLYGMGPDGQAVQNLIELSTPPYPVDFVTIPCDSQKMNFCPPAEVFAISEALGSSGVGLAWFQEPEILFASLQAVAVARDRMLQSVKFDHTGLAWRVLVKLLWENGTGLAAVTRYMEGYGIEVFVKGGKVRKAFVPRLWDD